MEGVLLSLAVLACPLSMVVMGWFMVRGKRRDKSAPQEVNGADDLRAQHARLGAEIERLERDREPAA